MKCLSSWKIKRKDLEVTTCLLDNKQMLKRKSKRRKVSFVHFGPLQVFKKY